MVEVEVAFANRILLKLLIYSSESETNFVISYNNNRQKIQKYNGQQEYRKCVLYNMCVIYFNFLERVCSFVLTKAAIK